MQSVLSPTVSAESPQPQKPPQACSPYAALDDNDGDRKRQRQDAPNQPTSTTAASSSCSATSAEASALIIAAAPKAGMDDIDRSRIDAIILRESGDSAFIRQQRKRDEAVNTRIAGMKRRLDQRDESSPGGRNGWTRTLESEMAPEVEMLLRTTTVRSTRVVVDMDSFYISCEMLSRPDLRLVPACVGGGMITTSNYVARKYGVRSAMAGFIGDKLVEELSGGRERLVHVPLNFDLYKEKAEAVRTVLREYDPGMRSYSLDEAYLDLESYLELRTGRGWDHRRVAATLRLRAERGALGARDDIANDDNDQGGPPAADLEAAEEYETVDGGLNVLDSLPSSSAMDAASEVVREMRAKVCEATGGLTCSAGLAPNFMLAKIASDQNKPDGQLAVGPSNDDILSFVRDLPVRKVPGVGRVTDKILGAFEVRTVKDLFDRRAVVRFLFKPATASFLLRASLGRSDVDRSAEDEEESSSGGQKGISHERTFRPGKSWDEINSKLEDITRLLADDMRRKDIWARTVTLKVKLDTFDVISKSKSAPRGAYMRSAEDMIPIVARMLIELRRQHGSRRDFSVRLLGVRCSNLRGEDEKADSASQQDIQRFLAKGGAMGRGGIREDSTLERDASQGGVKGVSPYRRRDAKLRGLTGKRKRSIVASLVAVGGRLGQSQTGSVGAQAPQVSEPVSPTSTKSEHRKSAAVAGLTHICTGTTFSSPLPKRERVQCPICCRFLDSDNNALNRHVDACLNSGTVRQIVKEESTLVKDPPKRKRRLADFFSAGKL